MLSEAPLTPQVTTLLLPSNPPLLPTKPRKKEELRVQALQDQVNYDALNFRDGQFDLSDALLAISIALLAVIALTQLWALYWVALAPTLLGLAMGAAGLIGLAIHPTAIIQLLSGWTGLPCHRRCMRMDHYSAQYPSR